MPKKQEVDLPVVSDEPVTLPAISPELEAELAAFAEEDAALERPSLPSISLRSGVMTYLDTAVPDNNMDVIVIGFSFERSYFTSSFDSDNIIPPDCFALSLKGEDMGPSEDYGQGTDCESCEQNKWKSAKTGKGKACHERRRLVVVPASVLETGTMEGAELAMLKIPTTSVKNWGTYINKLRSAVARPSWAVVTNIKVTPDAKTQFKVNFDFREAIASSTLIGELRKANAESEIYTMQPFDMTPPEKEEEEESDKF